MSKLIIGLSILFTLIIPTHAFAATIILDPGHGSKYSGRKYEGKIELQILQKLRDILVQKSYNVVMTHETIGLKYPGTNNEYSESFYKADFINRTNPDLVLRLHSDSHNQDRFFIMYPREQTNDSKGKIGPEDLSAIAKSRELSIDLSNALMNNGYLRHKYGVVGEADLSKHMNTAISTHVWVNTAMTLIELFGHGNPNRKLLTKYSDPTEQAKVATALSQGIEAYLQSPTSQLASNYQPKPDIIMPTSKVQPKVVKKVAKKVVKKTVKKKVIIRGKITKKSKVKVRAHSDVIEKSTTSDEDGNFEITFDNLSNQKHWFEYSLTDFDEENEWVNIGSLDLSEPTSIPPVNNPLKNMIKYLSLALFTACGVLCVVMLKKPNLQVNLAPQEIMIPELSEAEEAI